MTRVKPVVSVFIQWFDLYVCLCICCCSCKTLCEEGEFEYRNSRHDIGCVKVIRRDVINFDESERICMSHNGANTPIFVDKNDATFFVGFLNKKNIPVVQSFFYVDYQRYRVVSNEIESSSVFCFVPTVETTTEIAAHQRYHHIIPDQSSEEQSNCGGGRGFPSTEGGGGDAAGRQQSSPETVCKGLEENPDNYESQVDSCAPCVAAKVGHAIVGGAPLVTLVPSNCQNRTSHAICVRSLQEYRCILPIDLQDGEFLDGQVRFFYDEDEKRCMRYECQKDLIKKDATNCTTQEQCLNMGARKICFVGVEPKASVDKPGPSRLPSSSSQVNILSESTIWIIIVGCLVVFLVMIVILLYIVNTKVDGTPLPTSLNVFEYWRNRQNFHQANFESEPVESAYNALSACETANNSAAIPIHFDAEIRRTLSNGAATGVCYLDFRGAVGAGASQASSTCDVLGEPPPIYNDMFPDYRRHQRRIDSTPSINSMGEIPPAYTSRPVSASSSLMSVLTGAFSHGGGGGHFAVGGCSRYASYSDMHNDDASVFKDNVPLRDSGPPPVCRDRNFSGKKVKFQPDGSLGNPRSRHASDFEATRNRRRHASDLPPSVLSSSAGASAFRNVLASNSCQQSTDTMQKQPNLVPKELQGLKPALRSRHRSEEQNRNYSHQGFMNGGNVRVPVIQPPPPNPSSRRRNASQDSSGNCAYGNSKNNLNETKLSSAGSSATNITSKAPTAEVGGRPAKVFGPSNRHRHVSADQTLTTSSHRSRKDSDLVGLLDDQSPLILTSGGGGMQGSNREQAGGNPFSFLSKGYESATSTVKPGYAPSGSIGDHNPASPIASSDNAISSASNANVNQNDVFASNNQNSACIGSTEGRPRSRSVTDRSGSCDSEKTQKRGGLAAAIGNIADRTSGIFTDGEGGGFRLSSLTGRRSLEGSNANVSIAPAADSRTVQASFSRNGGAVNASYEDESAC